MPKTEEGKRVLAEAEKFLSTHGLTECVQSFLASAEAKRLIKQSYSNIIAQINEHRQNAPEKLLKCVEEIYDVYANSEKDFNCDIVRNFKVAIHMQLKFLPEKLLRASLLIEAFQDGDKAFINLLEDVLQQGEAFHGKKISEKLLECFPEEIADLLRRITDCTVIQVGVISPEYEEDDSTDPEAEN